MAAAATPGKKATVDELAEQLTANKANKAEVEKVLKRKKYDNFKSFSDEEWNGHRDANGFTCMDRMKERIEQNLEDPKGFPLGANFFSELKREFRNDNRPEAQLQVESATQDQIQPRLWKAMNEFANKGSRAQMGSALMLMESCNEAECVGVLQYALELNPQTSADQHKCAMDVVRWMVRMEIETKYPDHFKQMIPWLTNLFGHLHKQAKGVKTKPSAFVKTHKSYIFMVLPKAQTEKIISHEGAIKDLKDEIAIVVNSGDLGQVLFGPALVGVIADEVKQVIQKGVEDFSKLRRFDRGVIIDWTKRVLKEVERVPLIEHLPEKRQVELAYRQTTFPKTVKTTLEHVESALELAALTIAVDAELVPYLWCEADLGTTRGAVLEGLDMAEDILEPWRDGRTRSNSQIGTAKDSASIKTFLQKRGASLASADPHFPLMGSWFESMMGEAGATCLEECVRALLPTAAKGLGIDQVAKRLRGLQGKGIYAFCDDRGRAVVDNTLNCIDKIQEGKAPQFLKNATPFMASVKDALKFFCTTEGPNKATLSGKAAIDHIMDRLGRGDKAKITYDDLELPTKYQWLLDEPQTVAHNTYYKTARENGSKSLSAAAGKAPAGKRAAASSASSGPAVKAAKTDSGKSKKQSEVSKTLAMFNGGKLFKKAS